MNIKIKLRKNNRLCRLGAIALDANDGINGADAGGQMLWALSYPEWRAIAYGIGDSNGTAVRSYGTSSWWLRSPGSDDISALAGYSGGGSSGLGSVGSSASAVRPAFNLALTSVLFASDASTSGAGKSAATTTSGYQSATQPTSARKFTFLTSSIATPTLVLQATPLDFTFSDAPTALPGAAQYVSGFLTNDILRSLKDAKVGAIALKNAATPFALKDLNNQLLVQIRSTGVFLTEGGMAGTVQKIDLVV
ncbi:hypothetical protein FACS189488_12710 [Betaproteobacteria bacterium]|nr:hypothetical protein FACS189488_12710 [Betaproteobacteria bacterium]